MAHNPNNATTSTDYRNGWNDAMALLRIKMELEQSDHPEVVPEYQRILELIKGNSAPLYKR